MDSADGAYFNYRPLLCAALGFTVGLAASLDLAGAWGYIPVCLFAICAAFALMRRKRALAVFLYSAALGGLRYLIFAALPTFTPLDSLARLFYPVRDALGQSADALFHDNAPLVRAILLGDRTSLTSAAYSAFRDSGIAHVLALSGLHVSMLAAALMLLLPKRFPRVRFAAVALFLLAYCCVTAFPASLVRASVMTLMSLGSFCFTRRRDSLCSISAAALVILMASPDAIGDVGFQLSFAAVGGIILLYEPFCGLIRIFPKPVREALAVSLSGTLGTLPLTLIHFGRLATYSLFANLFLLPLVPFALIPAFAAMVCFPLLPDVSEALAAVSGFFFDVLTFLTKAFASVPYSVLAINGFPALAAVFVYLAFLSVSPYLLRAPRFKKKCAAAFLALAALFMLFARLR